MKTVSMGGLDVRLHPPKSYATCYDVWICAATNERRALAAALGVCWLEPSNPAIRAEHPERLRPGGAYESSHNPAEYGGRVIDALIQRGVSMREISAAGAIAYGLVAEVACPPQQVQAAADFSEAPER